MDKSELLQRIGDISQLCDAKRYRSISGRDDGNIYIQVYNAAGLSLLISESRGLDIVSTSYKGTNLSYITKNKVTSPYLFEEMNDGFRRSFFAGMLTTCGMSYNGAKSKENDIYYGTHGRFSNTPAEDVNIIKKWENEDYIIEISGYIKESKLFGENTLLKRTITITLYGQEIKIRDEVINQSFSLQPLMLLYHFNIGYPILDEKSRLRISPSSIRARDEIAALGIQNYDLFSTPQKEFDEQVFYHADFLDEICYGEIYNPDLKLGVSIEFNSNELPLLLEWKMLAQGEYVLGIEPSTNTPEGYTVEKENNRILYLKPQETKIINLKIKIKNY